MLNADVDIHPSGSLDEQFVGPTNGLTPTEVGQVKATFISVLKKGMAVRRYVAAPANEDGGGGGGGGGGGDERDDGLLSSTPAKLWITDRVSDGGGDADVDGGGGLYNLHWTKADSGSDASDECHLEVLTSIWEPTREVRARKQYQ